MSKQERKEYMKAWKEAHKEQQRAYMKAWHESHKEQERSKMKAWRASHKKEWNDYQRDFENADLNSLGKTKHSIRSKSRKILKQINLKLPDYEIHHCFGYEDAKKFIYISKSLHLKIHKYLRDHNISADSNHWMQIRDIVNDTDEFTYIRC